MDRWLGVEIRHLAALEAIAAERSFRGAADRLGYVQSAVSQQLSALERIVGARLVERSRGHARVELTQSGELLLRHAERILGQLTAARADLQALTTAPGATVRIGALPSTFARVVPPVLAELTSRSPELCVVTTEAAGDGELQDAVARGDMDLAVGEGPLVAGPFEAVELLVDPCVLVVPADTTMALQTTPPTLQEIAELPLALPRGRMSELIEERFAAAGVRREERFATATSRAVQALVSAGVAATLLPRTAVDRNAPNTTVIELDGLLPSRSLILFWHGERLQREALAPLIDTFRRVCRRIDSAEKVQGRRPAGRVFGLRVGDGSPVIEDEARTVPRARSPARVHCARSLTGVPSAPAS